MNPNLDSNGPPKSLSAPIIERAPLPIVEVQGKTHLVTYVNPAFCRLVGKTARELVGTAFAVIVPRGEACIPILDSVYETGEALTHTLEDNSDPNPAHWLYAMWPSLNADGVPAGVIIQMTKAAHFRQNVTAINEALLLAGLNQYELRDQAEKLNARLQTEISERMHAEAALRAAKERLADQALALEQIVAERTEILRETVGELEAFSYSVAHDLRAPLRSIQGYASGLLDDYGGQLDDTAKLYLNRMARSAVRMDRLIQDVLSYTKVISHKAPLETVDAHKLLTELIESNPDWCEPAARVELEGNIPAVLGHEAMLAQCVSNLLNNAIKFVGAGIHPHVRIGADVLEDTVRIWFADNGIGIAKENHQRIFRMFERIFPASDFEGNGIGLTIVRKAVDRMQGLFGFESELGRGSRFWIQLRKAR